ncbi:MAG TPA: hypothetical protein VFJ43_09570 [Bacteroidia bacterium]|nr:hypothetical protein [Bacteroidia bacterium]
MRNTGCIFIPDNMRAFMKISKCFLFILMVFSSRILSARENHVVRDSVLPHDYVEISYGTGMVNNRLTMAAGSVNFGYKQFVFTARLCRSTGTEMRGYIFENAFMLGYRFGLGKYFNTTFSGGYSDLAFEHGYHTYFNALPDMFDKAHGYCFEAEAEFKVPSKQKTSPFSLAAVYYTTLNSRMNLNGFMIQLKFCFDRYGEHWYNEKHNML